MNLWRMISPLELIAWLTFFKGEIKGKKNETWNIFHRYWQIQENNPGSVERIRLHQTRCRSHQSLNTQDKNSISQVLPASCVEQLVCCTGWTVPQHTAQITAHGRPRWWIWQEGEEFGCSLSLLSYKNRKCIDVSLPVYGVPHFLHIFCGTATDRGKFSDTINTSNPTITIYRFWRKQSLKSRTMFSQTTVTFPTATFLFQSPCLITIFNFELCVSDLKNSPSLNLSQIFTFNYITMTSQLGHFLHSDRCLTATAESNVVTG